MKTHIKSIDKRSWKYDAPLPVCQNLIASYVFSPVEGELVDVTTDPANGVISNIENTTGLLRHGARFRRSKLSRASLGNPAKFALAADENLTIEFYGKIRDFINIQRFICYGAAIVPGDTAWQLLMASQGYAGMYVIDPLANYAFTTHKIQNASSTKNWHIVGRFDRSQQYVNVIIDGEDASTNTYGDARTVGAITSALGAELGSQINSTAYNLSGDMFVLNVSKSAWSDDFIKQRYFWFAGLPTLIDTCDDLEASSADITSGLIPRTLWEVVSGAWRVRESLEAAYLTNAARTIYYAGEAAGSVIKRKSIEAFGSFKCRVAKANDADIVEFQFIRVNTATGWNGYMIRYDNDNHMKLIRRTGAAETVLLNSANTYPSGMDYHLNVTRTFRFAFEVVVETDVVGNVTNNTHKTSEQIRLLGQSGSRFEKIRVFNGVVERA